MVRIAQAEPLQEFSVRLRLTNGSTIERDLAPLLIEPLYRSIRDPQIFRQLKVVDGTLQWPNGLDLDPDMVIWRGPPPAEQARQTG